MSCTPVHSFREAIAHRNRTSKIKKILLARVSRLERAVKWPTAIVMPHCSPEAGLRLCRPVGRFQGGLVPELEFMEGWVTSWLLPRELNTHIAQVLRSIARVPLLSNEITVKVT